MGLPRAGAQLAQNRHAFNTSRGEQIPFRTTTGRKVSLSAGRAPRVRGVTGTPPPPRGGHRVGIRRADVGGSKRRPAPYKALGRPAGAADRAGRGESSGDPRAQARERSATDSRGVRTRVARIPGSLLSRVWKKRSSPLSPLSLLPPTGDRARNSRGCRGCRGAPGAPGAPGKLPKGEQWP